MFSCAIKITHKNEFHEFYPCWAAVVVYAGCCEMNFRFIRNLRSCMPKRGSRNTQKHAWNILLPNKNLSFIVARNVDFLWLILLGDENRFRCLSLRLWIHFRHKTREKKSSLKTGKLQISSCNKSIRRDNFSRSYFVPEIKKN